MVLRRDDGHLAHVVRELDVREELAGLLRVGLHVREFVVVELAGLLQVLVAHRDLPVVMKESGRAELLQLDPGQTHPPTDDLRISRHPLAVPGGLLIPRVDRHGERLDEGLPETPLFRDELGVLDRHRSRSPE